MIQYRYYFKMFELKGLILLVFLVDQVFLRSTDHCFADPYQLCSNMNTDAMEHHLGQNEKTRYQTIPSKTSPIYIMLFPLTGGSYDVMILSTDCKPIQIWMMIEDGMRYPDASDIQQMSTLKNLRDQIIGFHEKQRSGSLNTTNLENLKQWQLDPHLTEETAGNLTEQGIDHLMLLGQQVRRDFPELFTGNKDEMIPKNFEFYSRNGSQTRSALIFFMSGLFNRGDIARDPMLINEKCVKSKNLSLDIREPSTEVRKFESSSEYQNLILQVSQRLGFPSNLTEVQINLIYDICHYEKTRNTDWISPWCAIFTDEELKLLEYRYTMKEYYKRNTHENRPNIKLGCTSMQDLYTHFKQLEKSDNLNKPKGIFQIKSLESLNIFKVAMGFVQDSTPPLASNYAPMKKIWQDSESGPLTSSVAAVFYKCNDTASPNKVRFYTVAKEKDSSRGCDLNLCNWEYLKNKFVSATSNCDLDVCSPSSTIPSQIVPRGLILLTLFILIITTH